MTRYLPFLLVLLSLSLPATASWSDAWEVTKTTDAGEPIVVSSAAPLPLPLHAVIQVSVADANAFAHVSVHGDAKAALLESRLLMRGATIRGAASATVTARVDGQAMATYARSSRTWSRLDALRGNIAYQWRYPKARNTWEDRDRLDIGADYAALTPLNAKRFTYRLIVTAESRQIWLDDRLVSEARMPTEGPVTVQVQATAGAAIRHLRVVDSLLEEEGRMQVPLEYWSHAQDAADAPGVDLGKSLYRYRMTHGTGPDAPYVNARVAWPSAFEIDPAVAAFRVPYRPYKSVELLVAVPPDAPAYSVPKGVFQFYRQTVGATAATPFAVTPDAIASGAAVPAGERDGHQLYRLTLPVDTNAFYGFRDMHDQFLEFQLTKPLAMSRSYADPIYYGSHPAGPPSSLRVLDITLIEAPFTVEVVPLQTGHVFRRPEAAGYLLKVRHHTGQALPLQATLRSVSHDGTETQRAVAEATLDRGGEVEIPLALNPQMNGWHKLTAVVTGGDFEHTVDLSFVILPPDTRTYGDSMAETRFGVWNLWGHYAAFTAGDKELNRDILGLLRRIGIRRIGAHSAFLDLDMLQEADMLPKAPHTIVSVYHRLDENDPESVKKMVEDELAQVRNLNAEFPGLVNYHYGGEWGPSREATHSVWPIYQGKPPRELTEAEAKNIARQTIIFTAIGEAMREHVPQTTLVLQWGAPTGTIPFMRTDFPKHLVDAYGMDQPMFERLPENLTDGSIHYSLWQLRAEQRRLGWPELPIQWVEGPFLPTNPGALTEQEQADYQIRYWLLAIAYGVEVFDAAVVPFDAGNYYGSEHYGAGVFHRDPLLNPKPAVAAINTATTMLCGATYAGPVATGSQSTYCMRFEQADGSPLYALWRVRGSAEAALSSAAQQVVRRTDAMGNTQTMTLPAGESTLPVGTSPVWIQAEAPFTAIAVAGPRYGTSPAATTHALGALSAERWRFDGSDDPAYTDHHFGVARAADPSLSVTFGEATEHGPAAAVTLPETQPTAPLLARYGTLVANEPIEIPGDPSHLGIWIDGNSGFGRITWQLRDAKGELWTSAGTANDWNADDIHGHLAITYDGWRYVRFPLPGNHPWDQARKLETTWWGSTGGDGIVDLPLTLEKIYVEARNLVPYISEMQLVEDRTYRLAGPVAEYAEEADTTPQALLTYKEVRATPDWTGPVENPIARLREEGVGQAPTIADFEEPHHWPDGRRMIIRFDQQPDRVYNVYLSLYEDGRGAELLTRPGTGVNDNQLLLGLKPGTPLYLFLTYTADGQESKPSPAYKLVTRDNFSQK